MPSYDYKCSECNHTFEKSSKIADRKVPETEPCPACQKLAVQHVILTANPHSYGLGAEARNNAGGFKEVLQGIHERSKHLGSTLNNNY